MPGPKPKPTGLKLLQGNPGHQKLPQKEPHPRPLLPDMPPYLGRLARRRWKELLPELDYGGVLSRVDSEVLGGYCQAYEQVCRLTADLEANGRTYEVGTNGAQSARPEVAMLNRAWDDIRKFGAEMGIGAASRTKIEVRKPDASDEDPVEKAVSASARRR